MKPRITFVSAGAGSGKTHRLTELLHTRLASGEVRASGVIATTFTRKAAAELRERARTYLMTRGDFALATALDQARIGTVNSVCGDLLLRFAFEAALPSEYQQVLDEERGHALLEQAIDSILEDREPEELNALADRLGVERWQEDLRTLVDQVRGQRHRSLSARRHGRGERGGPARPLSSCDRRGPRRRAVRCTRRSVACPRGSGDGQRQAEHGRVSAAVPGHAPCIGRRPGGVVGPWAKLSKAAPEAALAPAVWRVSAIAARHAEHPRLHGDLHEYLRRLFALCARGLGEYAERKRGTGLVDFVDQEHLLLRTLDHAEVRATLADELDLLLVDEFQDTSPIQLALFLKLAALAREVFWVGDVKQAIYGFRGSDTALMEAVLGELPEIGEQGSARMVAPVAATAGASGERVFGPAFAPTLPESEVHLHARRTEPDIGAAFGNWLLQGRNINDELPPWAPGSSGCWHRAAASSTS